MFLICALERTAIPMLADNNIASFWDWFHAFIELHASTACFEYHIALQTFQRLVYQIPAFHGVLRSLLVHAVINRQLLLTSELDELVQVGDHVALLEAVADSGVELSIRT